MIPVATNMTEVDQLPGEEVAFSIADARWVMRSLADLYSNRELAVVREYSTNARDAMVEAGKADQPIHVNLPSITNPYFTVQDFGIGMSEEDLKGTYTRFGDSTKRESNDFNGMLGFGSKSAIAYTNTFTVTSVKDGIKTVAVITRKEDYSITLKVVLGGVKTNESNGTTVQVPVNNPREFEYKAKDFYRYWKPGTVMVNGVEPKWMVGEKLAEGLYMNPAGESYVVMGNVAYRINNPDALFPRGMNRISFVAYVENGAVEFTPNREDLKYSEHTKAALHKVIGDFVETALEKAKKEIADAKTHADAFIAWTKWRNIIGHNNVEDLTFKGDKFSDLFLVNAYLYNSDYYRGNMWRIDRYQLMNMPTTVIVLGFTVKTPAAAHKKKVRDWAKLKNIKAEKFLFVEEEKLNNPWLDPARMVQWEQVKIDVPTPKKPRAQYTSSAPGRLAGTFDLLTRNGTETEQDVPDTKELYYIMVQESKEVPNLRYALAGLGLDWKVVLVPANRKDKFLRNYPHAQPVMPAVKKKIVFTGKDLISDDGKLVLDLDSNEAGLIKMLDENLVDDPEVKNWIRLVGEGRDSFLKDYTHHLNMATYIGERAAFKPYDPVNSWHNKKTPVTQRYPMVNHTYLRSIPLHQYIYMNALYKARKEGSNV